MLTTCNSFTELVQRFYLTARKFESVAVKADGCYLFQSKVGKEVLIVQLEPYFETLSFLGELDNPTSINTFSLVDAIKILKALITVRAYNALRGTDYGWKTILQKDWS